MNIPSAQPDQPRIKVRESAVLRDDEGAEISCTIVDISREGFRLEVPQAVAWGPRYTLSYGGEAHPVEIRWLSPGEAGGRFLEAPPRD